MSEAPTPYAGFAATEETLRECLETLQTLADEAMHKDRQEYEAMLAAVQTGGLNCNFNRDKTDKVIQERIDNLNKSLSSIRGRMNGIPEMCGYRDKIRDQVGPGWDDVLKELQEIRGEMSTLGVDDWQGQGGDAYRCRVSDQAATADKHIGLADNAGRAIKAVADVQDAITQAVLNTFRISTIESASVIAEPAASFSMGSKWNPFANSQEYSFIIYKRTSAALHSAQSIDEELSRILGGDPWRSTSKSIDSNLNTALNNAATGNTMSTDYQEAEQIELNEEALKNVHNRGTKIKRF